MGRGGVGDGAGGGDTVGVAVWTTGAPLDE